MFTCGLDALEFIAEHKNTTPYSSSAGVIADYLFAANIPATVCPQELFSVLTDLKSLLNKLPEEHRGALLHYFDNGMLGEGGVLAYIGKRYNRLKTKTQRLTKFKSYVEDFETLLTDAGFIVDAHCSTTKVKTLEVAV